MARWVGWLGSPDLMLTDAIGTEVSAYLDQISATVFGAHGGNGDPFDFMIELVTNDYDHFKAPI